MEASGAEDGWGYSGGGVRVKRNDGERMEKRESGSGGGGSGVKGGV